MNENKTFIIAEAGVNHNGSVELAKKLIDAAAESMADAVKFQTWKTENIITKATQKASYQKMTTGEAESQFDMLKKLELDFSAFCELKEYASKKRIVFLSTPDDEESVDFLDTIDIPFFKIGSGEVTNVRFLKHVASKKKSIVLSTGMSTLSEVERAVTIIKEAQASFNVAALNLKGMLIPPLTLLHCLSSYPAPIEETNLKVIRTMSETFKVPVGYSDHTEEPAIALAAVTLGASILEKHFTLDRMMSGPDHSSSFDPVQFKAMVIAIRNIERSLGDGIKRPMPSEENTRQVVRKNLVAACDILAGTIITSEMITAKRAGGGLAPDCSDEIVGHRSDRNIMKDEIIKWEMFF